MAELSRDNPVVRFAGELADPVRFAVLDLLCSIGPAAPSELATRLGVPLPRLSNHLKRLRRTGLVEVERSGRHAIYELSNPFLGELLENLKSIAGGAPKPTMHLYSPLAVARTCYDHLGGRLGVAVFEALLARGAITVRQVEKGEVGLGPNWQPIFGKLGIAVDPERRARRRFAFACLDWSERRPHLGGALGAALLSRFLECGWVQRIGGTRALHLTLRGRRTIARELGVDVKTLRSTPP